MTPSIYLFYDYFKIPVVVAIIFSAIFILSMLYFMYLSFKKNFKGDKADFKSLISEIKNYKLKDKIISIGVIALLIILLIFLAFFIIFISICFITIAFIPDLVIVPGLVNAIVLICFAFLTKRKSVKIFIAFIIVAMIILGFIYKVNLDKGMVILDENTYLEINVIDYRQDKIIKTLTIENSGRISSNGNNSGAENDYWYFTKNEKKYEIYNCKDIRGEKDGGKYKITIDISGDDLSYLDSALE